MAPERPDSDDKIERLRQIAGKMRPRKPPHLQLIPLEYTGDEEPTKVDRPKTVPPRSLPARAAKATSDGWHATPKPVQFVAALTALVGALAALAQALAPLFR